MSFMWEKMLLLFLVLVSVLYSMGILIFSVHEEYILIVFCTIFLRFKFFVCRLEPQLKQLQTKYDDLEERKSSLKNSTNFLSNLKQLYHDYSEVQEKEPKEKEKVSPTHFYRAADAGNRS